MYGFGTNLNISGKTYPRSRFTFVVQCTNRRLDSLQTRLLARSQYCRDGARKIEKLWYKQVFCCRYVTDNSWIKISNSRFAPPSFSYRFKSRNWLFLTVEVALLNSKHTELTKAQPPPNEPRSLFSACNVFAQESLHKRFNKDLPSLGLSSQNWSCETYTFSYKYCLTVFIFEKHKSVVGCLLLRRSWCLTHVYISRRYPSNFCHALHW